MYIIIIIVTNEGNTINNNNNNEKSFRKINEVLNNWWANYVSEILNKSLALSVYKPRAFSTEPV